MAMRALCLCVAALTTATFAQDSSDLWRNIKAQINKPDGREWFETHMKDAVVPGRGLENGFRATVLSSDPADRPRTLIVAVENESAPDAKLELDRPFQRPIAKGAVIVFEGIAADFTLDPYILAFKAVRLVRPARTARVSKRYDVRSSHAAERRTSPR